MTFGVYLYFIAFLVFSGLGLFVQYRYFSGTKKSKKDELATQMAQEDQEFEQLLNNKKAKKK